MPKSCNPKSLSNTIYFSDNLGTYIANGQITTNQITTNGDIILTGDITNGSNSITFTENTLYTNIPENFFIGGTGLIQYQGVNYNIGQILSAFVGGGTIAPYPSITYDASLNATTFTGLLVFPANSIASTSINNTTFVDLTTAQSISNKTFSGTTIFSSIQLDSNLIVNTGGTTILNSNLALINFLSGTSSNINTRFTSNETNITALQTKTTSISYNTTSQTTTFVNKVSFPLNSISSSAINNSNFVDLTSSQTITASQKSFTGNIRLDGSLLVGTAGNVILTNATLQKIAFISDVSSAVGANLISLQSEIDNINLDLGDYALETEVQAILDNKIGTMIYYQPTDFTIVNNFLTNGELQYTPDGSTKINLIPIINSNADKLLKVSRNSQYDYFDINSNCHIFGKLELGNYPDVEYSLGAVITAEGVTAAATGLNTAGLLTLTTTTIPGINLAITGLGVDIADLETEVGALQIKTSQMSYNSLTSRTTISETLNSPNLEIGNLESGFNQTANEQITLSGVLRCNNRVEINNTLELINNNSIIVEGIINQDNALAGTNQFLAPTNLNGNVIITNTTTTINAATTQIGTNAIDTLNCNATASFGGDITMLTNKNLRLKNIVPILLDDIYFGGEAGVHTTDDVFFNMKVTTNQPLQINNTCQIGTTINRNTLNAYTTTAVLDGNTGITLTSPVIGITSPSVTIGQNGVTVITVNGSLVQIGQTLGINYIYGTTYVQNLYSTTGVIGAVGNVFQQFV